MLAILTVDQRGSRSGPDLVPAVLDALNSPDLGPTARAFERTAGDEVQGVLDSGASIVARIELLLRQETWNIGLGLGAVEEPLPASTRAGRGEAFVIARQRSEERRVGEGGCSRVRRDLSHRRHRG